MIDRRTFLAASVVGCSLAGLELTAEHARATGLVVDRQVDEPSTTNGSRARVAPTTLVFPEMQYQYSLYRNYLIDYLDRPLLCDRSLRPTTTAYTTAESYLRDIASARDHGFDGTGSLAVPSVSLYTQAMGWLDANPARAAGHLEFPEFAFGSFPTFSTTDPHYVNARTVLQRAIGSPYSPSIAGRIPVVTYNSGYVANGVIQQFVAALRAEFGDVFALVGQLVVDQSDSDAYVRDGAWSTTVQDKYRARITELLGVYDGLQLEMPTRSRGLDYRFEAQFGLFDSEILPMVQSALALPANTGKLLAAQVRQGYANQFTMLTDGEFGTARLRHTLDRLVGLNPDIVFFFEWNEFNENTCVAPTMRNGLALRRILHHYTRRLKGLAATALPGDDVATPPLVLSHRDEVKLGEKLEIELLNVPDTTTSSTYQVTVGLHDVDGNLVALLGTETFDRSLLRAVTYMMPSEQFAGVDVLCPRLTVTTGAASITHTNLEHIRVHPTISRRYPTVRQSLRDLTTPSAFSFDATAVGTSEVRLELSLTCGESLHSVEVLENGIPFHAVDSDNEYDLGSAVLLRASTQSRLGRYEDVTLTVTGSTGWQFHRADRQQVLNVNRVGDTVTFRAYVSAARNHWYVTVPSADVATTQVAVTLGTQVAQTAAVADVVGSGQVGQSFYTATDRDTHIDWRDDRRMPDIAAVLGTPTAVIDVTRRSAEPYGVYQVRAVTSSGRQFRSAPVMPRRSPGTTTLLPVVSETTGQAVSVAARQALVPEITYALATPASGDVLTNSHHPSMNGELGGGLCYQEPFSAGTAVTAGISHVPTRAVVDGRPVLTFDTAQSWISLPIEAFPRGAFTLIMEVKPTVAAGTPYVVFRHFSTIVGSITVFVDAGGQLVATFVDRKIVTHTYLTGLTVPANTWSELSVAYDLTAWRFAVGVANATVTTPTPLLAMYAKPAAFGGHTTVTAGLPAGAVPYRGHLASLTIRHSA